MCRFNSLNFYLLNDLNVVKIYYQYGKEFLRHGIKLVMSYTGQIYWGLDLNTYEIM